MFVTTPGVIRVIENNRRDPARPRRADRRAGWSRLISWVGRTSVERAPRLAGDRELVEHTG